MLTLMYHDVVPESRFDLSGFQGPGADLYKLGCEQFRRHMRILARFGPEPATLTFDDGGEGALQAADILEEFGLSGHFFITTDRIGSPGFLTESQIRSLHHRGHRIGSHSCSHPPRMSQCSTAELNREWEVSVRRLEEILSSPVTTASVPGGYYSNRIAAAAARAGIRLLFNSEPVTSARDVGGCEVQGRFTVQRGSTDEWIAGIASGSAITRFRSFLFWNAKKAAKTLGGNGWLKARRLILAHGASMGSTPDGPSPEASR